MPDRGTPAWSALLGLSVLALGWAARGLLLSRTAQRLWAGAVELAAAVAGATRLAPPERLQRAARRVVALQAVPWFGRLCGAEPERGPFLLGGVLVLAALGGAAAVALTSVVAGRGLALLALLVAPLAPGGLAIRVLVTDRAARRRLEEQLPIALELLAVALAAGLPVERALRVTGTEVAPPLRRLLGRAAARVGTGERAGAALRHEAGHSGVLALERLAAVVERAAATGRPLAGPVQALATELRAARGAAQLAAAGRAAPLAALVTAVVIAPACVSALVVCLAGALSLPGGIVG